MVYDIVSFDLDFKQNLPAYDGRDRDELCDRFRAQISERLAEHGIIPWIMVFSGNGIHLHFKLGMAYPIGHQD